MAKTFDATTKHLVEAHPVDWLRFLGLPVTPDVRVVDADLSSFTLAADKVVLVNGESPYIVHVEFQTSGDVTLDGRMLLYNVVLRHRHKMPVFSVVILLRPEALSPATLGRVSDSGTLGSSLEFSYRLVRVWELSLHAILAGGIGTLPLALISAVPAGSIVQAVEEFEHRLGELPGTEVAEIETAAFILMGLRFPRALVRQIVGKAQKMKESETYQIILEEGEARGEARGEFRGELRATLNSLIRIGTRKFGPPSSQTLGALSQVADVHRLERLIDSVLDVAGWEALLAVL